MKILFFTRRYSPNIGGVETHVEEVTKRLTAMGHTVTIVSEMPFGREQSLSDRETVQGTNTTVYRIPINASEKQKKFTIWKWLWKHRSLIEGVDVVHCHDVFYWYLPFRFRYPLKKAYTTFHGYETVYPPSANAIRQRKIAALLSRGNIAVGDYIRKWYGTHSDYVTYGGTGEKISNDKLLISNQKRVLRILFVG